MEILACKTGKLHLQYSGIPVDEKIIRNSDWHKAVQKIEQRLGCWQGRTLSIGGRTILINSHLSGIPLYMLSFYRISVGAKEKAGSLRASFLWSGDKKKKK